MCRLVATYTVFMLSASCFAQTDGMGIAYVDRITYQHYLDEAWEALIIVGEKAEKQDISFYYLDVRMGIAHYSLEHPYKAAAYLNMALKANPKSETPHIYLHYIALQQGDLLQANYHYAQLSVSTQATIEHKAVKQVDYIYLEGGAKMSDIRDSVGAIYYGGFGLGHLFGPVHIFHSYTYITQNLWWGEYRQHEYSISPTFRIKSNNELTLTAHFLKNTSKLDYDVFIQDQIETPDLTPEGLPVIIRGIANIDRNTNGTYNELGFLTYLGYTRKLKRLSLNTGLSILTYKSDQLVDVGDEVSLLTSLIINNTVVQTSASDTSFVLPGQDTTISFTQLQPEVNIDYVFPFWKNRLSAGIGIAIPIRDSDIFYAFSSRITLQIANPVWLTLAHYAGNSTVISEQAGTQFNNGVDLLNHRIRLVVNTLIKKRANLYITLQWEDRTTSISDTPFHYYALFTGLKIRL